MPVMDVDGLSLALFKDRNLYFDQVVDRDSGCFFKVVGKVVENREHPGLMGIKNLSGSTWRVTHDGINWKDVPDDHGAALIDGMEIQFGEKINNLTKVLTGKVKG